MWQRFSENARRVVFYAQEEAQKFGEGFVSTEHLLLGLVRESDHMAAKALTKLGVSPARITAEITKRLPRGDARPSQDMTLTPRAKRVIDLAYDEARNLSNNYIGTEHILLGLVREGDGLAGRVLATLNVELEATRRLVAQMQKEAGVSVAEPLPDRGAVHTISTARHELQLPVQLDLRLLHPVDQFLVGLLCDKDSDFGKNLRERNSSLDWVIPAIVATMKAEKNQERDTLSEALNAVSGGATPESLYKACFLATTTEVRKILIGLGLDASDK